MNRSYLRKTCATAISSITRVCKMKFFHDHAHMQARSIARTPTHTHARTHEHTHEHLHARTLARSLTRSHTHVLNLPRPCAEATRAHAMARAKAPWQIRWRARACARNREQEKHMDERGKIRRNHSRHKKHCIWHIQTEV